MNRESNVDPGSDVIERRLLEDLWHALQGPLSVAYHRTLDLVQETECTPAVQAKIGALRSDLERVRIANFVLTIIIQGQPATIMSSAAPITMSQVLSIVSRCAEDFTMINSGSRRCISCKVDKDSFQELPTFRFTGDRDLLTQALNNIVDNAFKYSYSNTTVVICALRATAGVFLEVRNTGIRVLSDDIPHVGRRGWRSREAARHLEGSGLGLWIASHIAVAHAGYLEAIPTNSHGETRFRIFLPRAEIIEARA